MSLRKMTPCRRSMSLSLAALAGVALAATTTVGGAIAVARHRSARAAARQDPTSERLLDEQRRATEQRHIEEATRRVADARALVAQGVWADARRLIEVELGRAELDDRAREVLTVGLRALTRPTDLRDWQRVEVTLATGAGCERVTLEPVALTVEELGGAKFLVLTAPSTERIQVALERVISVRSRPSTAGS